LFGCELLVAPIYDETGRRPIYLPKGKWIDYWNGEEYEGPTTLDYKAPLHVLPLFVKENSIIPMGPEMSFIPEKPFDYISLDIYLHDEAKFTLYDNDKAVDIKASRKNNEIILNIGESKKTWIAKIKKTELPSHIDVNSKELKKCPGKEELDRVSEGWWWDDKKITYVKVTTEGRVTIRVKTG